MNASVPKATPLCLQYPWKIKRFNDITAPIATGLSLWLAAGMLVFEYLWEHVEIFQFAYSILNIFPKFSSHFPFILWSSQVFTVTIIGLAFIDIKFRRRYAV